MSKSQAVEVLVATRGNDGIGLHLGPPAYKELPNYTRDDSRTCRAMAFSRDGKYFAWTNGQEVTALSVPSCTPIFLAKKPRTMCLCWSPQANILATWEPYATIKDNPTGTPNLDLFEIKSGKMVKAFFQKKNTNWEPHWTSNEEVCARIVNNEVQFYEKNNFDTIARKLYQQKVAEFSLSPALGAHVACYSLGSKGQPSFVRLYKYPKVETAIANKSFFKADKVQFIWSANGTSLILLLSSEVDKSGASYYGEQALHFMDIKGDTCLIKLPKEGPIYTVQWSPNSDQFCILYGYMPAKGTLYNCKCEAIFDFGTGPRNEAFYNPRGTLLALAGFGNLQGNLEVWDVQGKRLVSQTRAPNTTHLAWSPDSQHFLTATTAPRLRVSNGFRIWHYTCSLQSERQWPENQELWEVQWQPLPSEKFPKKPISLVAVPGIQPTQAQASTQAYRPPGARGIPSNFKLHDKFEPPSNQKASETNPDAKMTKNKKKKEAKKAKKETASQSNDIPKASENISNASGLTIGTINVSLSGDVEKDKKIRGILKKLDQITKLREQEAEGKQLEKNQVEKISKEDELIKELGQLQMGQ